MNYEIRRMLFWWRWSVGAHATGYAWTKSAAKRAAARFISEREIIL
jgi:hypothetical protein